MTDVDQNPTHRPFVVGELVALVPLEGSSNGSGDGVLWRVTKVINSAGSRNDPRNVRLWVEPCWCATGETSLRPKNLRGYDVRQRVGFERLGVLRAQLDDLCREALALSVGIPPETV